MNTKLDRAFQEKEEQYLTEKRQLENKVEQIMEEKRAFHRYLDHLSHQLNYPTPYYVEVPNRQVVYRLLMNSKEEADRMIRHEQLAIECQLEEKQKNLQKERITYEEEKRKAFRED